jgi:hypothetical protein
MKRKQQRTNCYDNTQLEIVERIHAQNCVGIRTKRSKIKVQLLTLQNNLFIQQSAQSEDLSSKFALL